MTDNPTPTKPGSTSWSWTDVLDRIRWAHVAILAILVAGVVTVLLVAPDTAIGHVVRVVVAVLGVAGGVGTTRAAGVLREPETLPDLPPRPMPTRTVPRRDARRDGAVDTDLLVPILAGCWALLHSWPTLVGWASALADMVTA